MKNPVVIPPEIQKENERKPIPFGLWDIYREKYNWQLEIELPDNAKVKDIGYFLYNKEHGELFGVELSERYKEIPKEFLWNTHQMRAIPSEINTTWVLENRHYFEIQFNEQEIFQAFKKIYEDNPNTEAKLTIHINEPKTYANVKLVGNGKEVWIMNNKILVDKTDYTY